jgi:hypothetical protein
MHGEMRNMHTIFLGNPEGRGHSEELGIDRIILNWILRK